MKKIFIMNLGTTSFKFKLYSFSEAQQQVLASGEIESVGALESAYDLQWGDGKKCVGKTNISDHGAGFAFCVSMLQESGILSNMDDLDAVGYKAVHGGSLSGTQIVTDALLEEMERMVPLAPAHNPIYLQAMRDIRGRYPNLWNDSRLQNQLRRSLQLEGRTGYPQIRLPWLQS